MPVRRVLVLGLGAWSLVSLLYISLELGRVKFHAASCDSHSDDKPSSIGGDLPEPQHSLIVFIGQQKTASSEECARYLKMSTEALSYYTEELKQLNLIYFKTRHCLPSQGKSGWELHHEAKEYLIHRDLLK